MENSQQLATINANIYVHAFLANSGEYEKSPHFLPENRTKVRKIVEKLLSGMNARDNIKALDFGCGTGFMIQLIHDLFTEVHGIDIAQDMMKFVDMSPGNIMLHQGVAEATNFPDAHFDFACAYSFMDHLFDYESFLKEAYRILKPSGIFYSDLNPNRDFATAMKMADNEIIFSTELSPTITREIKGMLRNGEYYHDQYGMDPQQLEMAEPIKSRDLGFSASEVVTTARRLGFSDVKVEYDWFLGQAKVMHEGACGEVEVINSYLTSLLPVSSSFFKYLRFIFIK